MKALMDRANFKNILIRKLLVAALLAAFTFLPCGNRAAHDLVLCFGTNGHVAVEAAHHGRCCPVEEQIHHQKNDCVFPGEFPDEFPSEVDAGKSFCGHCVDIPLSNVSHEFNRATTGRAAKIQMPPNPILSSPNFSQAQPRTAFERFCQLRQSPDFHLISIGTIQLLI